MSQKTDAPPVIVRPFREPDADLCVALAQRIQSLRHEHVAEPSWASPESLNDNFARYGFKPEEVLWVLEEGQGNVCGFVGLEYAVGEQTATIHGPIVAPECRRRGWGSRLMSHALSEAQARSIRLLHVSIGHHNNGGQAFAEAHGFVWETWEYDMVCDTAPEPPSLPPMVTIMVSNETEDLPALYTIYRASFPGGVAFQDFQEQMAEDEYHTFVIARWKGHPVGFLRLERYAEGRWWIHHLGVLPEYRGRGIGSYLLASGLTEAWRFPDTRTVSLAVHTDNESATGFYERQGFRVDQILDLYQRVMEY